jgi:N-methylhydantoinase A
MRFAVDTGGTFTDLVLEDDSGEVRMYKASTTPSDPVAGVLDTLELAAQDYGISRAELLAKGDMLIHGTTHAINAIVTGNTARTAFLTTKGHPDVLVLREGGRIEPFNFTVPYPQPYVPRSLTYEIPERVMYDGTVREALDEKATVEIIGQLKEAEVEAVAVCLLWSIVNPAHEDRLGELLEEHLPGVPYTLSHVLNPSLREYRRASSAAIDASLKPLMGAYMGGLDQRLRDAGFSGRVLVVTTQGGAMDAADMAKSPIHSINSGPAMAPLAGRAYAEADSGADTAIIADTGGTTFDVSLVRGGRIPWTRETWIGQPYRGHMTGFPAVDVKSIGAGGGSIAWVDEGGLLHIGPRSAGAVPGPVCYGQGGTEPTVTDASVVLGWIDPDFFLGGAMSLDREAAAQAIQTHVGDKLGFGLHEAAAAILSVATENMVHAIEDITVNQGIDPRGAVLIGGGGAAGLNVTVMARRLGCERAIIPDVAAALSAAGALMSDLRAEYSGTLYTQTAGFETERVNELLARLEGQCREFIAGPGAGSIEQVIEFTAEARYPSQIWEIEVPLRGNRFSSEQDIADLREDFHNTHEEIFAIADRKSEVEVVGWRANVRCRLRDGVQWRVKEAVAGTVEVPASRKAYFADGGLVDTKVLRFEDMARGEEVAGPAIIESSFTTVVVDPGASAQRSTAGSLVINPAAEG